MQVWGTASTMEKDRSATRRQVEDRVPSITIVDDDLAMEALCDALSYRGFDVARIGSVESACEQISQLVKSDLVILDIILPFATSADGQDARTGGMRVLKEIRRRTPKKPVLAYTATHDGVVIDALMDDAYTEYLSKWERLSLRDVVSRIYGLLGLAERLPLPKPFIVHGHDEATKWELKNYLQNSLQLSEPIILHEQPNMGRTVIEKFETYGGSASLVFVLLTPDDQSAAAEESDEVKRRARQNVIFELGWFLGRLGRLGGRVILLHKGKLEIPSDIGGVVYIDISGGIEAAGEKIRREIDNVWKR